MTLWTPIPNFPKYEISSDGQVRRDGKLRSLSWAGRKGYQYRAVKLYSHWDKEKKKDVYKHLVIHKLMWESFYGPVPSTHQVNHKDKNRHNNTLSNLECVTVEDNRIHRDTYEDPEFLAWSEAMDLAFPW